MCGGKKKMSAIYRHKDEIPIREDQYHTCRQVHDKRPFPSTIKRYLQSELLKTPPEFFWGGKLVQPTPAFEDILHTFYLPAIRDIMDEIWTLGIVAIRMSKIRTRNDSDRVPIVMKHALGVDYTITVRRNPESGRVEFTYYRLKDNSGKNLQKPALDKWVYVLSGFGNDPLPDGTLTSRVSSLVKQEAFIELNYAFNLQGNFINANPTMYSQTTKDSDGTKIDEDYTDTFGGQDALRKKEGDRYDLNAIEIRALNAHNQLAYSILPDDKDPLAMKRQHVNNAIPLPVNNILVRQQLPQPRTDWREMNEVYQEIQAAAYGVPRITIMTGVGVKQAASAELATRTIDTTINEWKRLLGKIFTDVYCVLYGEEDCRFALGKYASDIQALTAAELFIREGTKLDMPRVLVKFPIIPHDNLNNLLLKYSLGLVSWDFLQESTKALSGYSSWDSDDYTKVKEPWSKEERMMLFHMSNGGGGGGGGTGEQTGEGKKPSEGTQDRKKARMDKDDKTSLVK